MRQIKNKKESVDLKHEIVLDVDVAKKMYPWLSDYIQRRIVDWYLKIGYAPKEVVIPREFLFLGRSKAGQIPRSELALERFEIIDRICAAFKSNGYSYYQQYRMLQDAYQEQSLFALPLVELKRFLLEVIESGNDCVDRLD